MPSGSSSPRQRTCTVSLRAHPGAPYYSVTTMGSSLFEVVARAMEFFQSPFWRGPRPTPETVFLVQLVGEDRRFFVRGRTVELWNLMWALVWPLILSPRPDDRHRNGVS